MYLFGVEYPFKNKIDGFYENNVNNSEQLIYNFAN